MINLTSNQLKLGVLISLEGKSTGTGFLYKEHNLIFLVTAKHVLYNENDNLRALKIIVTAQNIDSYEHELHIFEVNLEMSRNLFHQVSDVAIVLIGYIRTIGDERGLKFYDWVDYIKKGTVPPVIASGNAILKFENVKISNDVYVFGYPTSIGLRTSRQFDSTKPLLRKGIVANVNRVAKTIILDCSVYAGNSGGPVVQVSYDKRQTLIIGIISQYIPYVVEWTNRRDSLVNTEYLNSGYSVATSIDPMLELIEEIKQQLTAD